MEFSPILNIKNYKFQHWITCLVFLFAMVFLYFSVESFLATDKKTIREFLDHGNNFWYSIIWVFGPPAWFFFEYFVLWGEADDQKKNNLKAARELAQPFWAAALYFLFLLVPK